MEAAILVFSILIFFGMMINLVLSVTLINVMYKLITFKVVEKPKPKPERQLMDLPMRYERQYNYGDAVGSTRVSDDLRLTKDI